MTAHSPISSYTLFGETVELGDVLHIETIYQRSQPLEWNLKPHRHDQLHQLLVLTGGKGEADIDGNTHPLTPPCLINVPRGSVHGFRFGDGMPGWVISLTSDLMDHSLPAGDPLRAALEQPAVLPLPTGLKDLTNRMMREYDSNAFGRSQLLRGLALAVLALTARAISSAAPSPPKTQSSQLFTRFETLVDRSFRRRWPLAAYARELAVSATHLNRITHQATGRSASSLIRARTLREARRLLIYTNLSAAQIAYELGFADPAHFSRYFAKGTGVPPRKFRQQLADKGKSRTG